MERAEYEAIDAINWSALKEMRRSPLHFQHRRRAPPADNDTLRVGRAVHTAVLEPDRFPRKYVVWQGGRRYGKEWEQFKAVHHRETILTLEQHTRACLIRDAVRAHPVARPYLERGDAEVVHTWTDHDTGLACKARFDWLSPSALVDIKTARHAVSERAFQVTAYRLSYFHQLSFYAGGLDPTPPAIIVAVEPEAPFDVAVWQLSEDALYAAGEDIKKLLARVVECQRADRWPGAFDRPQELDLPRWAYPDEHDLDLEEPEWTKGAGMHQGDADA